MAEWKKEIKRLCKDFGLTKETCKKIISETENNPKEPPRFYKGNVDSYNYDVAYAHVKPYILGL